MDRETTIRRMKYLARRRATLELDLILGRVFDRLDWDRMSDREVDRAARVFEADDLALQRAFMGQAPPPPEIDSDTWDQVLRLARLGNE